MFVVVSKVFALILAAIVLSKSYLDFRSRAESMRVFLFWTITWAMIVVVALFPSIIDSIIAFYGGGRAGLGTFFGMAIVFLFFIVYRIYVKLDRIEQKLTTTIQELAIRDDWGSRQSKPRVQTTDQSRRS
jgi:hypothetical protein